MLKRILGVIAIIGSLAAPALAQTPPGGKPSPKSQPAEQQTPKPAAEAVAREAPREAAARPEPEGQSVNVRLELTITDQTGPGEPAKKVVTMFVADRQNGSIRTQGSIRDAATGNYRNVIINVDARPYIQREGAALRSTGEVRVDLGLEYQPTPATDRGGSPMPASLTERITLFVENGKPVTISQAADPISDRRISVELKATIVR
jgi:hypothetical protein